ncbi:DNA topoisomerase IB [Egicoccus sp. AB-alg6-2]|uniref:DNA topoisomerase IB n=1 Tax=Egicoccus sp. AB-alg6-2 TaxID=3242692 RepID=UPI00359D6D0A
MTAAPDDPTVTGILPVVAGLPADASAEAHAEAAGLVYVSDDEPGTRRLRRGRGFSYVRDDGTIVRGEERERMKALAIPPAWTDVWICDDPAGHIQATGIDDAGRKQYRYHPRWRAVRDATKFHRMGAFSAALPRIRDAVDRDLRARTMSRERVLALVVALLDETMIRIGSREPDEEGGAIGLTTLACEHVDVHGTRVHFSFPGKSGQEQDLELRHPRLARQLLRCEEIPGQRLFAWQDGGGTWRQVDSGDVNAYLREISGDDLTAKDFRTWGGTVVAAETLRDLGPPQHQRQADDHVLAAIDAAAERLGNTRAVCRASYLDPRVPKAYRFGHFDTAWDDTPGDVDGLSPAERAVERLVQLELPPSSELAAVDTGQ